MRWWPRAAPAWQPSVSSPSADAGAAAAAVDTALAARLPALFAATGASRLVVAWSGGLDSSVLLVACLAWARQAACAVHAVHVDHALHPNSRAWAQYCLRAAARLGVTCTVEHIAGTPPAGASVEAWARVARYQALAAHVDAASLLLTAHHADDQAETVLGRLLGGAGPHGLAGIAAMRPCGRGHLARPLLAVTRAALAAYATLHGLTWIEDPGNRDLRHPRNRLRHDVMPLLSAGWPGARASLGRAAELQGAVAGLIDAAADALLDTPRLPPHQLALATLAAAAPALRPFVLKRWLRRAGAPTPGWRVLAAIAREVIAARLDAAPCVRYAGCAIRRYDGHLYVMASTPAEPPSSPRHWDGHGTLDLAGGRLQLGPPLPGRGIAEEALQRGGVAVAFRQGGERCRPHGHAQRQTLKKLWQAWRVPPWERALTPLLSIDGELAAIGAYCVCADFAAAPGQPGRAVEWSRSVYAPAALAAARARAEAG